MAEQEDKIKISFETNADQTASQVDKLTQSINEQKAITIEFKKELVQLERQLKETPKNSLAEQKALKEQITQLKDAIKDQNIAVKELNEQKKTALNQEKANEVVQKNLKQQLREANIELQNSISKYGETSNEAIKSAKAVAELKDQMEFASDLSQKFNPDQKFKALSAATQLAGTGLQGVTSGMALFGDQSKETQEQLLKVQSAMAFSDAISNLSNFSDQWKLLKTTISEATISQKAYAVNTTIAEKIQKAFTGSVNTTSFGFKGLKLAIASTGIGLLVTGLAMVVTNFDKISGAVLKAVPQLEAIGKKIKGIFNAVTDFIGFTSEAERLTDKQKKNAENALKQNEMYLEKHGHQLSEAQKKDIELRNEHFKRVADGVMSNEQSAKIYNQKLGIEKNNALKEQLEKEQEIREKAEQKEKEAREKAEQKKQQDEQKENERKAKVLAKELELQKQLEDLLDDTEEKKLARQKERDEKEIQQLETTEKKKQELLSNLDKIYSEKQKDLDAQKQKEQDEKQKEFLEKYKLDTEEKIEYDKQIFEAGLQTEFDQAIAKIENDKKIAEEESNAKGGTDEEIKERQLQIDAFYNQKQIEEEDKFIEARKELKKREKEAIENLGMQSLSVAKDIFGKNKQIQKGIILAEGGVALGKVAKNTVEGVSESISASPLTIGMPWSGIIGAKGILDAATIVSSTNKALQSLGGGSLNGSGASPQAQGVSAQPQTGIQASSENQIATSIARSQQDQPPIKAFVVSKDVTTAQTLDANLIAENSL
jgi:hypothetical protein